MSRTRIDRVTAAPPPCGLPHHRPGQRVVWQRWRAGGWETVHGTVRSHVGRVLTVACDPDGRVMVTSCGHVRPAEQPGALQ